MVGEGVSSPALDGKHESTGSQAATLAVFMTNSACSCEGFSVVFFALPSAFVSFSEKVFRKNVCFSAPETIHHAASFV